MTVDPSSIVEFFAAILFGVIGVLFIISIACGTHVRN